jgi:hypothetical protein
VTILSPDAMQASLASWTDQTFLECLTIDHPTLDEPFLLVNDRVDLERTAGTFIAFPFSAKLQPRSDDMDAGAEIVADNVDQRLIEALRGLDYGATVVYEVVLADSPNTLEQGPFEYAVRGFSANASTISLRINFALDLLNEAFPKDYFAPWNSTT